MINRCSWCGEDPLYVEYHDKEWGVPLFNDTELFECLCLEGAQAGLSWITVLRKREGYRMAFDNFDYRKIAKYSDKKLAKLIKNEGIIRNRLKIMSVRQNAIAFLEVQKEWGNFSNFIWDYVDNKPIVRSDSEMLSSTELSERISKDLKKRGFKFVGSTIIYAFMQAVGLVNDHSRDCFRYEECQKLL
tara:strand:+ start:12 stop:575 length:564 start_codon:yes stop_codon:yes gene_type:complete